MEETLKDLKERRSIRAYKPEQIKEEELQKILEAGTYAPTGMGKQSPKIVVVQDKETREYLSELNAKYFPGGGGSDPFYGAPTVLVVLACAGESDECGIRGRRGFLLDSQGQRSV